MNNLHNIDWGVVIPTLKENDDDIWTIESIPEDVPTKLERKGTLNEARNRGVESLDTEFIIILDDDIALSETTFEMLLNHSADDALVGMEDWDFGLVAGRVMAFHQDLWEDLGGFDELLKSHMGDTDFAIRAAKAGYEIITLSPSVVEHRDHPRSITTYDRAWRSLYLCMKHPTWTPRIVDGIVC